MRGSVLSQDLGPFLRKTREQLGLSRENVAATAGVSLRLVSEFERGQRSNVSLESALRLLQAVGIAVEATAPDGAAIEIHNKAAERLARAARAARRRETWTARRVHLRDSGDDPPAPQDASLRIAAVREVSEAACAVASGKRGARTGKKRAR